MLKEYLNAVEVIRYGACLTGSGQLTLRGRRIGNDFLTLTFFYPARSDFASTMLFSLSNTIMLYLEIMDYLTANLPERERKKEKFFNM